MPDDEPNPPRTTAEPGTRPDEPDTDEPKPTPTVWERLTATFGSEDIEQKPQPISRDQNQPKFPCKAGPDGKSQASVDNTFCGGFHARSVHLTYVGHAGITTRLNEAVGPDGWTWRPLYTDPTPTQQRMLEAAVTAGNVDLYDRIMQDVARNGAMRLDSDGGLWIVLTVNGVEKIGYGDAQGKRGPNATKELIGDAIRNAAMRYGVGTYLWAKSGKARALASQHGSDADDAPSQQRGGQQQQEPQGPPLPSAGEVRTALDKALLEPDPQKKLDALKAVWDKYGGLEVLRRVKLSFEDGDAWASEFINAQVTATRAVLAQQQAEGSQETPAQRDERIALEQQDADRRERERAYRESLEGGRPDLDAALDAAATAAPSTPRLDAAIEAAQAGGGPQEIMQAAMDAERQAADVISPEAQQRAQEESDRALGMTQPSTPPPAPPKAPASAADRMRDAYLSEIRDVHVPALGVDANEYIAPLLAEAKVGRVREAPPSIVRAWTVRQRKSLVAPRLAAGGQRDAAQRLANLPAEQAATTATVFVEDPPF